MLCVGPSTLNRGHIKRSQWHEFTTGSHTPTMVHNKNMTLGHVFYMSETAQNLTRLGLNKLTYHISYALSYYKAGIVSEGPFFQYFCRLWVFRDARACCDEAKFSLSVGESRRAVPLSSPWRRQFCVHS